jgi:hypothetical protein
MSTVPEIIDPVFAKTSPKRSFSMTEYEHFGLVFTKTRVYKFGHRKEANGVPSLKTGDLASLRFTKQGLSIARGNTAYSGS